MRPAFRAALFAVPFVLAFVGLRACAGGSSKRWLSAVREFDPSATIVVDTRAQLVIATDPSWGARVGPEALRFRDLLRANYGDVLGAPKEAQFVIVGFSSIEKVQRYHGRKLGEDLKHLAGFHDPRRHAILVSVDSGLEVVRHETVHLAVSEGLAIGESLSPWLSEGLAQYFETYDPPNPPGPAPSTRLAAGRIDAERLLALQDYDRFIRVDEARNYREALVLTGFLLDRRPRADFVAYLAKDRTGSAELRYGAFRAIYRHDEEPFRRDLASYSRGE